ncbi:MAG: ABC transporter permease [Acidimicrobiales bacterium]
MTTLQVGTPGSVVTGKPPDDAPVEAIRGRRSFLDYVGPVAVFGLFIAFWYFMSYVGIHGIMGKPKFLVPPPHRVVHDSFFIWHNFHPILNALWLSTKVALIGLGISIVLGMALAIVMSQARWIERAFWPYLIALQAVPILAIVPIIGVILGYDFRSRVLVCVIISLFPIITNTLFGLLSAERSQHELFTLHGAGRITRLRKLQLPAALPAIFTGFRISAGLAVIGSVVGDIFFQRGEQGIGQLIKVYGARLNYTTMFGALIVTVALGVTVFGFFGWLSQRFIGKWHESTRQSA